MSRHGTRASYAAGCHCDGCRTAHATYMRRWRAGELAPRRARVAVPRRPSSGEVYRIGTWSRSELLAARAAT